MDEGEDMADVIDLIGTIGSDIDGTYLEVTEEDFRRIAGEAAWEAEMQNHPLSRRWLLYTDLIIGPAYGRVRIRVEIENLPDR